jgi:glycosyltransferase involved in cell wall biosynthesis
MQKISVVIASKVGAPFLDQCLESIQDEARRVGAETIVVTTSPEASAQRITSAFPWVRVVPAPELKNVPALRRKGVQEATGELVAVIEEHCSAGPNWLQEAIAALEDGTYGAAGGAITDFDYRRLRDWVVYFCEYNHSLPPVSSGDAWQLNDANIVYRRQLLLEHVHLMDDGYWQIGLHTALLQNGVRFRSTPGMVVYHRGPFDFAYYLHQRFLFSKAFAGARAQHQSLGRRAAYLVAAPVVPFLLLTRMAKRVVEKRCRVPQFIATLPLTVPALVVLVAGEWAGYLLGPGDALSKVE